GDEEAVFPAVVVFSRGSRIGLHLENLTTQQQMEFAQLTFARADTWADSWGQSVPDTPLTALRQVIWIGFRGFTYLFRLPYAALRKRMGGQGQNLPASRKT